MIRTSHPFLSRRFPFGEGARSNDAKDHNCNSEYDTWAGQCYLVFTRRIQSAHITVTSHTLKKKELQGKFRDFKTRFLWEEFRRICGFALLSLDEKRIIKISPITARNPETFGGYIYYRRLEKKPPKINLFSAASELAAENKKTRQN